MERIRTGNRKLMQELNTNLILDVIRKNGPISQAEVARVTRLSSGTVTNVVKVLKRKNLVRQVGLGDSAGGRKPVLLSLNPEARYVMSASFFADEITVAILDLTGHIKKKVQVPSKVRKGQDAVFKNFARTADSLLDALHLDKKKILGLGCSFEGIFDHRRGVLVLSNRFGWRDVPVRDILKKSYGLKTFVEADGRAMALGEYHYGTGKGTTNMICIDIDSGIGSAAILGGSVYHGASSMEGEIGHTLAVPDGPRCRCGKRGCLEAVASGWAFVAGMRRKLEKDKKFRALYSQDSLPEREIARYIFRAAEEGDKSILRGIEEIGHYLGVAVANVTNYGDPELIVLVGYMIYESGELLSSIVKNVALKHIIGEKSRKVRIEKGSLGEDAALIGAATLVYQDLFTLPLVYP